MNHESTAALIALIKKLTFRDEIEQQTLLDEVSALQNALERIRSENQQIKADWKETEEALMASIERLKKNQKHIEQINQKLSRQKEELKQQKQINEEKSFSLGQHLRKLELSYKEMEQFAYIASHDLKSPLRTISNFAQLLKKRNYDHLEPESQEFLDFIIAGARQMNEVICDSLEYSRVGQDESSFRRVNLNQVLETVRFNLKKEIEENNAIIVADTLPVMKANKTSIIQLFQNLISNSIKFRGLEPPIIEISSSHYSNGYEFRVSDNGLGMDESYQKKVFQPFQKLNQHFPSGTGIGLAICRKAVNMHNGEIRFESDNHKGTTFIFTLYNIIIPKKKKKQEAKRPI